MSNKITATKTKISTGLALGIIAVVAVAAAVAVGLNISAGLPAASPLFDREGLSEFSPVIAEKAAPSAVKVNQQYSAGSNYSLKISKPLSSLSVSGKITLASGAGLARIVLVDKNQKEYLVYESYSLLADKKSFKIDNICEETCLLDSVNPDYLRIEVVDANLKLDKVHYATSAGAKSGDVETQRKSLKSSQDSYKIKQINEQIKAKKMKWTAGETSVSKMSYADKKKLFISQDGTPVSELPDLQGFEYYKGGIFELKPTLKQATEKSTKSAKTSDSDIIVPDSWDWRNVHGENWMTSVKDQGPAGTCQAFAFMGGMEAQINLYYNNRVNIDLSEQIKPDCSFPGGEIEELIPRTGDYGYEPEAPDENCDPYAWRREIKGSPYCNYNYICSDWKERVWKSELKNKIIHIGEELVLNPDRISINPKEAKSINMLKEILIKRGPFRLDIISMQHAMVLEGYKTEKTTNEIIWIFKNSWGADWGENGYGEMKGILEDILAGILLSGPFTPPTNHSYWPAGFDNTIKCVDKDNDGYCNWGISEVKPSTCPVSCKPEKDCNDSNNKLGSFISDKDYNCCKIGKNCHSFADAATVPAPACVPKTCAQLGKNCGSWSNGCGTNINCGTCSAGKTCTNGVCACIPKTCAQLGKTCGSWSNGCGTNINCGTCAPASPTGVTANKGPQARQITATWHNPAGIDSLKLQRRTATGSWSTIATLSSKTTTYINTGLSCTSLYKYRIIAHNAGGDSSPSSETALVRPSCL
ncbi:MAG: hypothetical protein A3J65_02725 [Candidatus Buchananbacteria bacterium RIFCSPHIGHO2_02_FULL_45_11b]|uniref:Fibronectin type-III domain-containing protein n=1 Tax=Candidatus Buchananbacteria bacterium RIFCSPHIGHO2_02_FULL_45_11b TaxID=1797541 RepID=A0A1G1YHP3_9BACT|nr:MAG: hypothetical protein A3J65_02725 [Candidatus Buchananbacteria bacterium RIFCSPHIGHO2_02_FULL_45_11b]